MKMTFKDYSDYVLEIYRQKKLEKGSTWLLANPRPANIRDECLAVCRARYSKKDEQCLRSFFGEKADQKAYLETIANFDRDKFKPLQNFINGDTKKPDPIIIELLAWLLDVQPRPSDRWIDTGEDSLVQKPTNGNEPKPPGPKEPERIIPIPIPISERSGNPYAKSKSIVVIASAIEVIVVCALIGLGMSKPSKPILTGHEKCMYWKDDHYEPISCSQRIDGAMIIALDSSRLTKFKRITRPDTITKKDIGKVWYIKIKKHLEYYTDSGYYPLDPKLRVRPITDLIIDKYILSGQAPD